MCGLTKLGTNAVTISSKATIKERNNLCIHDTSISAFTFKVTHWITWYILTVISFYDRTCDHARVIQRYLSEYVISLNNHTCNLVCVTSKISFVALWLTFPRV